MWSNNDKGINMRSREEILRDVKDYNHRRKIHINRNQAIIEVLLDIRDLLMEK